MNERRRALIVGAHPDDCALGAGGFAVILKRSGWDVTFLTMTRGELGGDPDLRFQEEIACARILGVRLEIGELSDGSLSGPAAVNFLEAKINMLRPDLIVTHAPTDSHGDHRVLSESVLSAARRHASILFFEGPSTQGFTPALKIDITPVWDLKTKSLLAHSSQRERVRTVEWAEAAGRHRAWPHYRGMCEAFQPARIDLELMCGAAAGRGLTPNPAALAASAPATAAKQWRVL